MATSNGWFEDDDPSTNVLLKGRTRTANQIRLSFPVFLCSVLVASSLSFLVGHVSVTFLLRMRDSSGNDAHSLEDAIALPDVIDMPHAALSRDEFYETTGRVIDANGSVMSPEDAQSVPYLPGAMEPYDHDGTDDAKDPPVGQHLSVDIKGVDNVFLSSEERLTVALVSFIDAVDLDLVSFQCRRMPPTIDLSCVGILDNGHLSFYTWPVRGSIAFDLFIGEGDSLLHILSEVELHFGVPRQAVVTGDAIDKPFVQWSQKQRGFQNTKGNPEEAMDLHQMVLGYMKFEMKQHVVTSETKYQTIDVYDVIFPRTHSLRSYRKSLENDDSYEARNPDLFRPDRVIYLDGIMQSRFYGEAVYHEALVHPALITHENPKRVAIIGGGEGATLREILKHNTIETVTMIDIDEDMVKISREYIPEWSDCSIVKSPSEMGKTKRLSRKRPRRKERLNCQAV